MPTLLELRDQVQRILSEGVGSLEVGPEGVLTFRHQSTRVFVNCREQDLDEGRTRSLVFITAPILIGVPPTPDLFEYVATNADNWMFGHLSAHPSDSAIDILMTHTLLGDYLDAEELRTAAFGIALTANDLDDELQQRFGGTRAHED